jgi:hypothetical protein
LGLIPKAIGETMISAETKQLIKLLIEQSQQKKLKWEIPDESGVIPYSNDFVVWILNNSINVYKDDNGLLYLSIYNNQKQRIEFLQFNGMDDGYDLLDTLLEAAKESYFNKDETINQIIEELKKPRELGNEETPF